MREQEYRWCVGCGVLIDARLVFCLEACGATRGPWRGKTGPDAMGRAAARGWRAELKEASWPTSSGTR